MKKLSLAALVATAVWVLVAALLHSPAQHLLEATPAAAHQEASLSSARQPLPTANRRVVNDIDGARPGAVRAPANGTDLSGSEARTPFVVLDENSAAVAHATVEVWNLGDGRPRHVARTGPEGRVLLAVRAGDRLEVTADEFAPRSLSLGDPPWDRPIRIVLRRGAKVLQARVVDELGLAVHGARLRMKVGSLDLRARSDGDGLVVLRSEYPLEGVQPTLIEVQHPEVCWPLEGVPVSVDFDSESPRTLRMFRWARLRIEVYGPNGERLESVRARLTRRSDGDESPSDSPPVGVATHLQLGPEPGGRPGIELRAPPWLDLSLWVEHPSFLRRRVPLEPLAPGEERDVVYRFAEADVRGTARVLLVDEQGAALSGAVTVHTSTSSRVHRVPVGATVTFPLPEADWRLVASSPGHASAELEFAASAIPPTPLEISLARSESGFEVRVIDALGSPVEGVFVQAFREARSGSGAVAPVASRNTDARGTARFAGLLPDTYRVVVGLGSPGGYFLDGSSQAVPHPARVRGLSAGDRAEIRLVPPSSAGGRALDLAGRSLQWSWMDPDEAVPTPLFTVSTTPGPDGRFLLTGLPPGRYAVWAAGGSFRSPLLEVDLGLAEELRGIEARAPR